MLYNYPITWYLTYFTITVNPDTPHTSREEEEEESRPPSPPSEDMILQVMNAMWRFNDSYSVTNVVCIIRVLYVCPHSYTIWRFNCSYSVSNVVHKCSVCMPSNRILCKMLVYKYRDDMFRCGERRQSQRRRRFDLKLDAIFISVIINLVTWN